MARHWFGGTANDMVVRKWNFGSGNNLLALAAGQEVTVWDAEVGGSRHIDLLVDGLPAQLITADEDGFTPRFQCPDGVQTCWADLGDGSPRRLMVTTDAAIDLSSQLATKISTTEKGAADGVATLGADSKIPTGQIPDLSYVSHIGPGTSDDTARINAALEACRVAGGGVVRGSVGANYQISSRLVIGSNTTLDLSDSTLTLKPDSNSNMVTTYAKANPVATANDGASTAGSDVITTSLAVEAQVGQTLIVTGAGSSLLAVPGQTVPANLTGVVAAIDAAANTITLRQLSGEPCRAGLTTSGAAVKLVNRDKNIDIRIGYLERGANGEGVDVFTNNSLFLRHVDGLRVDLRGAHSTAGKYTVAIGDVSDYWINATGLDVHSDGVHLTAAYDGHVELIEGKAGEDFLSVTCNDYTANSDISGPVDGLTIGNLRPRKNSIGNMLFLYPQSGGVIKNVKVLGQIDGTGTNPVTVGGFDDYDLGTLDNIDLGTIVRRRQSDATISGVLLLGTGTFGTVKATVINDPDKDTASGAAAVRFGGVVASGPDIVADYQHLDLTIINGRYAVGGFDAQDADMSVAKVARLTLRGYTVQEAGVFSNIGVGTWEKVEYDGVVMKAAAQLRLNTIGTTVKNLTVKNCRVHMAKGNTPFGTFYTNGSAAIEAFEFVDNHWTFADASAGYPLQVAVGTLGTIVFRGGRYDGCRAMVHGQASGTAGAYGVVFTGGVVVSGSRLCDFQAEGAMRVHLGDMVLNSMSAAPINLSTATLTLTGRAPLVTNPTTFVQRAGSESVRINAPGIKADPAILTPSNLDQCAAMIGGASVYEDAIYETNAAAWLPLRGSLRSGTATLVDGTVTVSNGRITANSVIRVMHKTVSGTPGALYVSAKVADTSFTITSTSATDTGVVRYEIVSY